WGRSRRGRAGDIPGTSRGHRGEHRGGQGGTSRGQGGGRGVTEATRLG
ncbi:MAG: hypothetical protein AVDCRST_MAG41-441, partial [uncultured Corynebacteriales bacterium]